MIRVAPGGGPSLIVFTDTTVVTVDLLLSRLSALLERARPESVLVVLRDKELPVRVRLLLGARIQRRCAASGQHFGVADRSDLAVILGADALHLGEGSIEVAEARSLLPPGTWVSRSCHAPLESAATGADAVVLSPIVAPRKGRPALGYGALTLAKEGSPAAVYALGGVDARTAEPCVGAGASGVAVIGAALCVPDPDPLLRALRIHRGDGDTAGEEGLEG